MSEFKIIKGAPAPPSRGGGSGAIYPFRSMEVGDAFDAPRDKGLYGKRSDARQASIMASAGMYAKRHNPAAKFTTRLVDHNTVRCWRIA